MTALRLKAPSRPGPSGGGQSARRPGESRSISHPFPRALLLLLLPFFFWALLHDTVRGEEVPADAVQAHHAPQPRPEQEGKGQVIAQRDSRSTTKLSARGVAPRSLPPQSAIAPWAQPHCSHSPRRGCPYIIILFVVFSRRWTPLGAVCLVC